MNINLLAVFFGLAFIARADMANVEVLVVEERTGNPVAGRDVLGMFQREVPMSEHLQADLSPYECLRKTDGNGRVKLSGPTNCGTVDIRIEPQLFSAYYLPLDCHTVKYEKMDAKGVWQPDDLVVTVRLDRIERPVPLVYRRIFKEFPDDSKKMSYDFLLGDWLPPVGTGVVADVVFSCQPDEDVAPYGDLNWKDGGVRRSMKVDFPGTGNGLVEVRPEITAGIRIRMAVSDGYDPEIVRWVTDNGHGAHEENFDRSRCYCFRFRTQQNAAGKYVGGYYGKIYGDIQYTPAVAQYKHSGWVKFSYYFNPMPLDRNLECDEKLLLPGSDTSRRVYP